MKKRRLSSFRSEDNKKAWTLFHCSGKCELVIGYWLTSWGKHGKMAMQQTYNWIWIWKDTVWKVVHWVDEKEIRFESGATAITVFDQRDCVSFLKRCPLAAASPFCLMRRFCACAYGFCGLFISQVPCRLFWRDTCFGVKECSRWAVPTITVLRMQCGHAVLHLFSGFVSFWKPSERACALARAFFVVLDVHVCRPMYFLVFRMAG